MYITSSPSACCVADSIVAHEVTEIEMDSKDSWSSRDHNSAEQHLADGLAFISLDLGHGFVQLRDFAHVI